MYIEGIEGCFWSSFIYGFAERHDRIQSHIILQYVSSRALIPAQLRKSSCLRLERLPCALGLHAPRSKVLKYDEVSLASKED